MEGTLVGARGPAREQNLVGRARELGAFDGALQTLAAGDRAVLMLSGEPGIGKTRLLEELAARVLAVRGSVAWGRMWEVGPTPPFWPWLQVLGALASEGDAAPAIGNLEQRADAAARLARFAEVAAFLARRSQAAPIAILLDDLHAADLSSLQLLEYVLPLLVRRRVLLALAARDSDCSAEVAESLGRIQRSAQRLPLARLQRAEVEALVADRADGQRVFELSEGNPLFVEELVAAAGAPGLPPLSSVRALIRARIAALPQGSAAALLAAAVLGRDFQGRLVAHMLEARGSAREQPLLEHDAATAAAAARLAPAVALGMVAVTGPDRYRFSHALVAEAIADELAASERARLHLRAAQAGERYEPGDLGAIAHHLLAAGHLAAEAAVLAAERAAQHCAAQLAFEDAAALLERALHALALAAPDDIKRRAQLLCARAEALQHAGRHAAAAALCEQAAALVRELARAPGAQAAHVEECAELFARIALARGLEFRFGRIDPLLVALLQEALALLGDASLALHAKLLARLAAAEQPSRRPEEPVSRALQAIECASQLSARDRLDVMYVATAALVDYVAPEALERVHHQVLALARGTDRSISVHTRLRLCFTALDRVDRAAFQAALQAFAAEAAALGLPRWTRQVHMFEALIALLEGRFDAAQQAAAQCEAISAALGDAGAAWLLDVHRVMAAWIKTEPVAMSLRHVADYPPGRAAISAWLAVQDGEREAARAALVELGGRVPVDPDLGAMVASAVAFVGDAELAGSAYDALAPRSGRIVLASMVGCAVMDLYDRLLLMLAATAGRWDAVDAHAQLALSVSDRLGSPVWAARVRADWAAALAQRARPGDAQRARELWGQALVTAQRLGMPGLTTRCQMHVLSAAPAPAVSAPPVELAGRVELIQSGELWLVRGLGEQVHVKASRGMQLLARLVQEPGRELHVLDLGGASALPQSDAGPALDDRARAAYRARIAELHAARDEAQSMGDLGGSERAQQELELLTAEIERAFGLGGRERRVGAASERARSNVQRRIRHALGQIAAASTQLGEHLAASVRTGTYCSYVPKARL